MTLQNSTCILLFLKAPRPGQVKTRLAKAIGVDHATNLYSAFVADLLLLLQQLTVDLLIFYDPPDAKEPIQTWLKTVSCYPQQGADLGEKLANAFRVGFQSGYSHALVLGSDSPDLPLAYLQEALAVLQTDQVVIGPAIDGGYYTLGFSQHQFLPQVFTNIAWSTSTVYADSLAILTRYDRPVHALPPWYDVDTFADLQVLYRQQHPQASNALCTRRYLSQHHEQIFGEAAG